MYFESIPVPKVKYIKFALQLACQFEIKPIDKSTVNPNADRRPIYIYVRNTSVVYERRTFSSSLRP